MRSAFVCKTRAYWRIGVNCAAHPDDTAFPATDLKAAGALVAPDQMFAAVAHGREPWPEWAIRMPVFILTIIAIVVGVIAMGLAVVVGVIGAVMTARA